MFKITLKWKKKKTQQIEIIQTRELNLKRKDTKLHIFYSLVGVLLQKPFYQVPNQSDDIQSNW